MASRIIIRGRNFLKDDKRFFIKGVVYQLPRDPIRDPLRDDRVEDLKKDVELFKELGINAIWVYSVNPSLSHHESMKLLSEAGIYVFIGLSDSKHSINRASPRQSYNIRLLHHYVEVIESMQFENVIGFIAANNVINNPETTSAAEVIRAVVRDLKIYMKKNNLSRPIGISDGWKVAEKTISIDYFTAGNEDEFIDFYSFTNFEWRPDYDIYQSGWDLLPQLFKNKSIPILISEYGNNVMRPRQFPEAEALERDEFMKVFSGGFAYEFYEEANKYGLVDIERNRLADFDQLKRRFSTTKLEEDIEEIVDVYRSSTIFPTVTDEWRASSKIPESPIDS